jgi:hypothetical protein
MKEENMGRREYVEAGLNICQKLAMSGNFLPHFSTQRRFSQLFIYLDSGGKQASPPRLFRVHFFRDSEFRV